MTQFATDRMDDLMRAVMHREGFGVPRVPPNNEFDIGETSLAYRTGERVDPDLTLETLGDIIEVVSGVKKKVEVAEVSGECASQDPAE